MTSLEQALNITLQNLCIEYPKQKDRKHKEALADVIGNFARQYHQVTGKNWKSEDGRGIVDYLIK